VELVDTDGVATAVGRPLTPSGVVVAVVVVVVHVCVRALDLAQARFVR
jgi:hypothetical protein